MTKPIWRGALAAAALYFVADLAFAQSYVDRGGTIIPGVASIPYPYNVLSPAQHNLAITTATHLTIPTGSRYAVVQCKVASSISYTLDGTTPTSDLGDTLACSGGGVSLYGYPVLSGFQAISTNGTLDVEYFQ